MNLSFMIKCPTTIWFFIFPNRFINKRSIQKCVNVLYPKNSIHKTVADNVYFVVYFSLIFHKTSAKIYSFRIPNGQFSFHAKVFP